MLETPHALVGAAIVTKIPNPVISIPLAFASHFILDMVPHWNPHMNTELKTYGKITFRTKSIIILDVVLAMASVLFVATQFGKNEMHELSIFMGGFAGILPDAIEAPHFFLNFKTKFVSHWLSLQKAIQVDTTPFPGLMTQVATIVASLWWIAS